MASSAVVGYREIFDKKFQNDGSGRPVLTLLLKRLEACKDFASFDPKLIRTSSEGSQAASKSRTMFKNYSTGIFLI